MEPPMNLRLLALHIIGKSKAAQESGAVVEVAGAFLDADITRVEAATRVEGQPHVRRHMNYQVSRWPG